MSDVLAALPPLAPGVRSYDRPLKERDENGELQLTGFRLIQLYKRDAPEDKRLATLFIGGACEETAAELASKLVERCKDYGYFVQAEQ